MFTTNSNQMFNFSVTDSTVYVSSGCTLVGNYVMDFRGDSILFSDMVSSDFTTFPNYYQYSVLCLTNYNRFPNLSVITASTVATEQDLVSPSIFDNTTSGTDNPPIVIPSHSHSIFIDTTGTGQNNPSDATTRLHNHLISFTDTTSTGSTDASAVVPHTHSIPVREIRPIGLFLFTNDGTNVIYKSSSRII